MIYRSIMHFMVIIYLIIYPLIMNLKFQYLWNEKKLNVINKV